MTNKRGIELSLNFLIILIISIIIFGFGVRFIYNLSSKATELQELTMSELDDRIGDVICEGSDRVCISVDRNTIKRTKFDVFGIKIINVIDDTNFKIVVSTPRDESVPENFLGYKKNKQKIYPTPQFLGLEANPKERSVTIEKNEEKDIGIGVQVPANAVPGMYILNVDIIKKSDELPYGSRQKLYVDVP